MKKYARIENGEVLEIIFTDGDIKKMFHPSILIVEAPEEVVFGWLYQDGKFSPPPEPSREKEIQEKITGLKISLSELDDRRIRPLAEGDTERLEELNTQARALRAELQALTEELREPGAE